MYCYVNGDFVTDFNFTMYPHTKEGKILRFHDDEPVDSIIRGTGGEGLVVWFPKGYPSYYIKITYTKGAQLYKWDNHGKVFSEAELIEHDHRNPFEIEWYSDQTVHVSSVSLDDNYFHVFYKRGLGHFAERTLTATIHPGNADNQAVTWRIEPEPDPRRPIITIERLLDNGKTALVETHGNVGEARVIVTTKDGGKTATCKVEVDDSMGRTRS